MEEEYKEFIYPYYVSNMGNVKNIVTSKILIGDINSCGYRRVSLKINGCYKKYFVHRLVAKLFVDGETEEKNIVNHIDGNKMNNKYYNLEWVTRSENDLHAYRNNLRFCNNAIKIKSIDKDGKETIYNSLTEAQRVTGIDRHKIRKLVDNNLFYKGVEWTSY